MKFRYAILYVKDVKATLDFYTTAFDMKQKMLHESGSYGELDTGATILAFSSMELMKQLGKSPKVANAGAPSFEIAFETDDVAAGLKKAVSAGAKLVQKSTEMPWGQTVGYVSDLDGFLVEICTTVET